MGITPQQVGAWLKRERERHGRYTQEQVAPLVGSTTRTVGAWERGETTPDADQLFALCDLYSVTAIDLTELAKIVPPRPIVTDLEGGAVHPAPRPAASGAGKKRRTG